MNYELAKELKDAGFPFSKVQLEIMESEAMLHQGDRNDLFVPLVSVPINII